VNIYVARHGQTDWNQKGILLGKVNVSTRGFVLVNDNIELLNEMEVISKKAILSKLKKPINYNDIKSEITLSISNYAFSKTGRKPIILPIIMEVDKKDILTK